MPSSASAFEIEIFEQEGIRPLVSDLRLDWTFESVGWNETVFSILAEDLQEWLEKGSLPPIRMKHVRMLAKEDGFGSNALSMLEGRVKKTLKNQEKNVQRHWGLQIAKAVTLTQYAGPRAAEPVIEKALARMRSRRKGVCEVLFRASVSMVSDDL
jgi:hypothetical protein